MNIDTTTTNGYVKYPKSELIDMGGHSTLRDLCNTFIAKATDLRDASNRADLLGIKQHDWTKDILNSADTVSEMAIEASKKNHTSLEVRISQSHFPVFARTLYHKGIRVKEVDNLEKPTRMLVKWDIDNGDLHPAFTFMQMCRENKDFTDFGFKIEGSDKTFPCHKMVIAWKSPFFKERLTGGYLKSITKDECYELPSGTLPETVEFLLAYLYDEKKEVTNLSLEVVEQLLEQAKILGLKQLKRLCTQHIERAK